jgi:hypothetical protein
MGRSAPDQGGLTVKISDTNLPPTDSWATLQMAIRLLQAGSINEAEFYAMTACCRAAHWTLQGVEGAFDARQG